MGVRVALSFILAASRSFAAAALSDRARKRADVASVSVASVVQAAPAHASAPLLDALVVLGGGVVDGEPPAWVSARLQRAFELHEASAGPALSGKPYVVCSGRGSAHLPSQSVSEAEVCARYLIGRGVPPGDILEEQLAQDTLGNAFFSRALHTDFLGLRRLAIITSAFHTKRAERIFRHVFSLEPLPNGNYSLSFEATPDDGVGAEALLVRAKKENTSILDFEAIKQRTRTMSDLHGYIFQEHRAYASDRLHHAASLLLDIDEILQQTYAAPVSSVTSGVRESSVRSGPALAKLSTGFRLLQARIA